MRFFKVFFVVLFLVGCTAEPPASGGVALNPTGIHNLMVMQALYFPMNVGTQWKYEITVNKEAYTYNEVVWPSGDQGLTYASSGFLHEDTAKTHLILKVDSPSSQQGPFQYPEGVKLTVVRDDYKIFYGIKAIYYNVTRDTKIVVNQVITYDQIRSAAPQQTTGDGYSVRIVFFSVSPETFQYAMTHSEENKPLTIMSLGQSKDTIAFVGFDLKVPGYEGKVAMHYRRQTAVNQPEGLPISITEDLWYIQNIGLVRLIQLADNKETMTWKLVQ